MTTDTHHPIPWTDDPNVAAQPENRPFWQAAEEGRLLGKACKACGQFHWTPRVVCPFCRSTDTHWLPLSGRGEVYACSTLRRASPPYTVAYVQLAEGPRMMSSLVGVPADPAKLVLDMPLQVRFEARGDMMLPVFQAAGSAA